MNPASGTQRVLTSPRTPSLRATSRSQEGEPTGHPGRAARRRQARQKKSAWDKNAPLAQPVGIRARDPTPPARRTSFEEKPDIVKYDAERGAPPSPLPSIGWDQRPGEPTTKRSASPHPVDVVDKTTTKHGSPAKQANPFGKTNKDKGKGKGKGKKGKGKGGKKVKGKGKGNGKGKGHGLTALRTVKRQVNLAPSKDERANVRQQ